MPAFVEYSLENTIAIFFKKTSATRDACDERAASLVGGPISPAAIQGDCSYTIYGGHDFQFVVQFRPQSQSLRLQTVALAKKSYGHLAHTTTYHGQLGENTSQETVSVYSLDRIPGISYIEFLLANTHGQDSEENVVLREGLITDLARFFAVSWKSPQSIDRSSIEKLRQEYISALGLLLDHLPSKYIPIIQKSLDAIPSTFSHLPFVQSHHDFSSSNIMVDAVSGRLTGIIDWAEAAIYPFGQILYTLQDISGTLHREHGWRQYKDHEALQDTFWETFQEEVGGLSAEMVEAIRSARILGCLLTHGFIRSLPNESFVVPGQETDEIRFLDAFLIDIKSRFKDLN